MGVLIYGAGGHGRVVRDALESAGVQVLGFLDDGVEGPVDGLPVWRGALDSPAEVVLGIGANATRRRVALRAVQEGHRLGSAVHARAIVSPRAQVGEGTVVFAAAVLNPGAVVGRGVILNTGAVVEHDCAVGDWAHLSPNATLGGAARVGAGAWIGLGAAVLPGVRVGEGAVLGAGAVAVRDIPAGEVWAGVPARRLR